MHGVLAVGLLLTAGSRSALGVLGSFEVADGYTGTFPQDVWSYDAGQTGAPFVPSQYNTGRWKEIFGSSNAGTDAQYVSRHGFVSGANSPPFALAVRSIAPSPDNSFDMTVRYAVGADDLGISPTTPLQSASITFDICPGRTVLSTGGLDTVFNDVPAFSLSFGGTDSAPGATIGFSDHDPGMSNRPRLTYIDGTTYNSQDVLWSNHFDQLRVDIDFVNQTYDLWFTRDANLATIFFDTGNTSQLIASGASLTSPINSLDFLYFRAHTDPSNGNASAGLEKSFLDNFQFSVTPLRDHPIPEPATFVAGFAGLALLTKLAGRRGRDRKAEPCGK